MKKIIAWILVLMSLLCGCGAEEVPEETTAVEPQVTQMRNICELATMECYYHNVAKFRQEDAEKFLWISKDKNFWIEYAGQVKVGVEASLITIEVSGDKVTVTMPPARVLSCKVDEKTLTKQSFVVAEDSAEITAEDEIAAFREAQGRMLQSASEDSTLLANARQRAQSLIEDYVKNIGNSVGKHYYVEWIDVDDNGQPAEALPEAVPETAEAV